MDAHSNPDRFGDLSHFEIWVIQRPADSGLERFAILHCLECAKDIQSYDEPGNLADIVKDANRHEGYMLP